MPPERQVEPVKSIADELAACNDHLDQRDARPAISLHKLGFASRGLAFLLNLNRTTRDILAFRDRVDNRTPPPLSVRR